MSKNSFKVKKGLTISPIDPSEIVNPEAGDLIVDSTDDNKMKRYDATSADWTSVGGSAGIGGNLMSEFEKLTPTLSNVTSVVDTVTFLPIDDNNKSIKATWSGSVGSIRFQASVDSSIHEIQGTVSVWLKTSLQNIQISSVQDGVKLSTLPVSSTNKWKQYELPVVIGGTQMGFIVESTTGVTGDVYIDQPFVGLTPSSYGFEVAQAEHVGNITWNGTASCDWLQTTSNSTFTAYTANANCPTPTSAGELIAPLTKIPGFQLETKIGKYVIVANGNFTSNYGATGRIFHYISDGTNTFFGGGIYNDTGGISTIGNTSTLVFNMESTSSSLKTIQLGAITQSTGLNSAITNSLTQGKLTFSVYYYPPKTTIVTQTQELTAQTSNIFSAKVSSTGVVSDENFDFINGNCSIAATSQFTCNFNSNIFTSAPNCTVSVAGSNRTGNLLTNTTTTQLRVETGIADTSGFSAIAMPFEINCTRSTDFNKSQLVVGQFEQIKSTELIKIKYHSNDGSAVDGNTPYDFIEKVEDNFNLWNGSSFISPRDTTYNISGLVRLTTTTGADIQGVWVDGVLRHYCSDNIGGGVVRLFNCGSVKVNSGQSISVRTNSAATQSTADDNNTHLISITELPDLAGIVKNLNDNKNVKCQTKYQASTVSSTQWLSNLKFNNLVVGKKYSIKTSLSYRSTNNLDAGSNVQVYNTNDVVDANFLVMNLKFQANSGAGTTDGSTSNSIIFTAKNTSLSFRYNDSSSVDLFGDNANFAQLCELPDYYIDTTEF